MQSSPTPVPNTSPSPSVVHEAYEAGYLPCVFLVDLLELDLEDELRVGRDQTAADVLAAVRKVGADVETRLLAELHLDDALVPACRTVSLPFF